MKLNEHEDEIKRPKRTDSPQRPKGFDQAVRDLDADMDRLHSL